MGRNARERARRKAEAKIKGVGASPRSHARPVLLLTWGIPGVGKTTFAKWLVKEKGFTRIDSDYPDPLSPLDRLWRQVLAGPVTVEAFAAEAST